jgi:hypothetical protein
MTTITLASNRSRNAGLVQVFGSYTGPDDRFTFGVRSFEDQAEAERYARRMMEVHKADHFERVVK